MSENPLPTDNTARETLVALLHGPDRTGLVARVAGWIFERGGNIIHADQHRDAETEIFFQRVEWQPAGDALAERDAFTAMARAKLGMQVQVRLTRDRPRVAIMVSKIDHCFHDLILRFRAGEMPGQLVAVLSNHHDLQAASEGYGLPFYYHEVTAETKVGAEAAQVALLKQERVDLVVMTRYMQVLSESFLVKLGCPVINIHHSFLPAFAGGRPYHQAFARGVKLIGATAHYATADLDEGPIIAQEVAQVSHRHAVPDLIRKGRDLEKATLAQAVRQHLENRILVYANKTVVFD
jgi:formyltetrahydrofolate deformylase